MFIAGSLFAAVGGTQGDARVTRALNDLGFTYELDEDGDYQLYYSWNDGRSQLVWVSGATEDFYHVEVREVFSYAYDISGAMPANVARRLLQANAGYKIGAWEMRPSGDGSTQYGIFTARIDADADAKTLKLILDAVGVTADEMEKELLGTDEW